MASDTSGTERTKEVKVKIPLKYHIKLHSVKVLTGQEISETVTAALNDYFHRLAAEPGSPIGGIDLRHFLEEVGGELPG